MKKNLSKQQHCQSIWRATSNKK